MKKTITITLSAIAIILLTMFLINRNDNKGMLKVGILKPVTHTALTQIKNGIIDELADQGFKEGQNIVFDVLNAEGNQVNMKSMSKKLINEKSDLVIGIGTTASQTLGNDTKTIPVIAGAVSNPEEVGLDKENVTGLSDVYPADKQIEFMLEIKPNISTLGVLYSSGDKNSSEQIKALKELEILKNITIKEYTISKALDLNQISEKMVREVDAVYIPTDNLLASLMISLTKITNKANIPVFPSADSMVKDGGLATISIGQYEMGREIGKMAADILSKKSSPKDMPLQKLSGGKKILNLETAKKLNIEIDSKLLEDIKRNGVIFE